MVCIHSLIFWQETGDIYAVKTFIRRIPQDIRMREFDILSRLNHQNIVCLLAIEEEVSWSHLVDVIIIYKFLERHSKGKRSLFMSTVTNQRSCPKGSGGKLIDRMIWMFNILP